MIVDCCEIGCNVVFWRRKNVLFVLVVGVVVECLLSCCCLKAFGCLLLFA